MIASYLRYLWKAGNEHSIHSPFLFELYTQVIRNKKSSEPDFTVLKSFREELLHCTQEIDVLDLGAGSRINKSSRRKVRDIARNAEKPEKFGRLFYRLAQRFRPETILELGTSLGLSTLYFAKAAPTAQVYTFEGCPETSRFARQNFYKFQADNIELITGNIDDTLPQFLGSVSKPLDLAYFDANHRYEPTVRYFEQCLAHAHNDSVFIFDDIYWSAEMTQAWEYIRQHPSVTLTADLFWIGLVFFRKEQAKEDFVLRF